MRDRYNLGGSDPDAGGSELPAENAVRHGGQTIRSNYNQLADGGMEFVVCDDGDAMTALEIARALEPFSVAGTVTGRRSDGVGLGLPLTNRIIQLHGGALTMHRSDGWTVASAILPAWRASPPANARRESA